MPSSTAKAAKKRPQKHAPEPLVFSYRHLPYGNYAIAQIMMFALISGGVVVYFQYFSKWRGGFITHSSAYVPVFGFVAIFMLVACYAPLRDLLVSRNERIEIHADRLWFINSFGRKKFDARLSEVKLLRAGMPITGKVKRYVFQAEKQSFFFSADISNLDRLLKLLNTPK
ncbi:MAG TPA: hypothetical protein VGL56_01280 [Fimbriimonadaceae bacterium]|jgi:hypothetical protein